MQSDPDFRNFHSNIDAMRDLGVNLSHLLRMTRSLIDGGRNVDIGGLERKFGLLCAKALDLPPEDGRALCPMLRDLLTDLDVLSVVLKQQADQQPGRSVRDN